jgi:hypothetical protein
MQPDKKERNPRYPFNGKQMTLTEIATASGRDRSVLRDRLARGLSIEDAVAQPIASAKQVAQSARRRSPWRNHMMFDTPKKAAK